MSCDLRKILDEELNLETEELITDESVLRMYRKAVNFYRDFRLWPRTNTYTFSIETGAYVPDVLMDQVVVVDGKEGKLSEFVDTQTRIFNGTATIQVQIAITSDNAYITGLPHELEVLFVAYCKMAIGQRFKFAKYPSQPLDIDAPAMYSEGEKDSTEIKDFIIKNRDEDPENITDLRKEAYVGVPAIFMMPGMVIRR